MTIPKKKDAAKLWEYALNALGRRALSAGEIRQKLKDKAADQADVEPAMAKLKEYGYLDDANFAETYASARRTNQSFGKMRVMRDLRTRRVGSETAEKAIEKVFAGTDELALAEEYVARKFRNRDLKEYLADPNHLASAYRKLRYAGFSSTVTVRVLKRHSERAEEIEE
jgi:regulatory protein